MHLWIRASIANAVALLIALCLTAFLGYDKFQTALLNLEREEAAAVIVNVRNAIEAATSLGLPLRNFADAQTVLDRSLSFDPKLAGLIVFDGDGEALFHALAPGEERLRGPPDNWAALTARLGREQTWSTDDEGDFMVGSPITAPSGELIGGVLGIVHKMAREEELASMARRLTIAALVLFLGASLLATALARRICPR